MRKNELIHLLAKMMGNPVVAILDVDANLLADNGDGSSDGVYTEISVEYILGEQLPDGCKPWISLQFSKKTEDEA